MHRESLVRLKSPFLKSSPARKPIIPAANICHGVQGPWEKMILDTSMVTAPTRKPVSPPRATPAIITRASTGLKLGSMKNAARPATPMAQRTAITTSSLAWGRLPSKMRKNGAMHSISTSSAMK